MGASAGVRAVAPAVVERLRGELPSRLRALIAATAIAAAAGVAAYRLLRSAPADEHSEGSEPANDDSE
jgi:hypothetical protein